MDAHDDDVPANNENSGSIDAYSKLMMLAAKRANDFNNKRKPGEPATTTAREFAALYGSPEYRDTLVGADKADFAFRTIQTVEKAYAKRR